MNAQPLIQIRNLHKTYCKGDEKIHALCGINLDIAAGEYVSIMGPSGSGKSTLFNMIGGLDTPSDGEVIVEGCRLTDLNTDQLAWFRCHKIGFIFQSFNLIPTMTALENVAIACTFAGATDQAARKNAEEVLDRVGLAHRLHHLPAQVSGGQRQRIAIARALVNRPHIILADEPTGNLDLQTGQEIIELLAETKRLFGITIITATHDMKMISSSDTLVRFHAGRIEKTLKKEDMDVTIGTVDGQTIL